MPVDVVAELEAAAAFPHVTAALADLRGITLSYDAERVAGDDASDVKQDVVELSERFAKLMAEYHKAISDGVISVNETKRLLKETLAIQETLIEMKLSLERGMD